MILSESTKNIFSAMCMLQSELKQPKRNASNPFFKSKYVTLDETVKAIKDLCACNGLSYTQSIVSSEKGIGISTMIMHHTGEYIIHDPFYFPIQQQTPQSASSSSSYARRYSLSAAFGIVSDDDDDGNAAAGAKPQTQSIEF